MRVDLSRMTAAAIESALDDGKQQRRPRFSGMRAVAAGAALAVAARAAVKHAGSLPRMPELSSVPDLVRERLADHGWLPDDEHEDDYEDEGYDEDDPEAEAEGDDDYDEDEDVDEDEDDDDDDEDDDFDGPEAEADEDDEVDDEDEDEDLDDEPEARADDDEEDFDDEPEGDADGDDEGDEEPDEARNGRRTTAQSRRRAPRLDVSGNGTDAGTEAPGVLELLSTRRSRPPVMSRRRRAKSGVDPVLRPPEPPERESDDKKTGSRK